MTDRDASGRFVKGISANPGGRPKSDLSLTALIDDAVTEKDWTFIIQALLKRARRGDNKAIEMLLDRRFGKAIQPTDNKHSGQISVFIDWDNNANNDQG